MGFKLKNYNTDHNFQDPFVGFKHVSSIDDFANTSTETIDKKKRTVARRLMNLSESLKEAIKLNR